MNRTEDNVDRQPSSSRSASDLRELTYVPLPTNKIPERLFASCQSKPGDRAWLDSLPSLLEEFRVRWSLEIGQPFDHEGQCSWVAPVVRADSTRAVLKIGRPHMEGAQEIAGLRFWDGNATVRLLDADESHWTMLLESCEPGTTLASESELEQDAVIASLLKRIWQSDSPAKRPRGFRHLEKMIELWCNATLADSLKWPDKGLVREGLRVLKELSRPASTDTLLVTDLHAGNVLRAEREKWLAIDPKPFLGDRAFDLVQHFMNGEVRLNANPMVWIARMADLAEVDRERLRLWTFARAAADPREDWANAIWFEIATALA